MRPLTEDQLSMLLSDAEVDGPVTAGDLDCSLEQMAKIHGLGWRGADKVLTRAFRMGLVPCEHCFGTGETRGVYWCDGPGAYVHQSGHRRYICTHCEGTGVAR